MTEQQSSTDSNEEKPDSGGGLFRQPVTTDELSDLKLFAAQREQEEREREEEAQRANAKEGGLTFLRSLVRNAVSTKDNILTFVNEHLPRRKSVTIPTDIENYEEDVLLVQEPTTTQTPESNDEAQNPSTELVEPRFSSLRSFSSRIRRNIASRVPILQEFSDRNKHIPVADPSPDAVAEQPQVSTISRVQEAILAVINEGFSNYGVTTVNPKDTLRSILIDDEDQLEKVLKKLGIDHLDFILTDDATVGNLVTSIDDLWKAQKKTVVPDTEGQQIKQIQNQEVKTKKPENSKTERKRLEAEAQQLQTQLDATPVQDNHTRDQLRSRLDEVEARLIELAPKAKRESLRTLAKRRKELQDEIVEILKKLENDDGLTPAGKEELEKKKAELEKQLSEIEANLKKNSSGVAWQSMVLTMGASMLARKGLIVAGATLLGTPVALAAVPVAGGIAAFRDAMRARGEGGATRLYQAASQDTLAALTTGRGKERKGRESVAEYQKNRWQGWKRSPLWLLRKVGAVANDPRARLVQGAYGVTRDRSTLSKFAAANEWENIDSINQEAVTSWVENNLEKNPELVMELGRRLNRLAALTEYGALDTAGERGSLLSRVSETHDAQFLEALHTLLDVAVQAVAGRQNDEKWQRYLTKWKQHAGYQSAEARKRAERSAKIKGVTASAVGTMMTAGVGSVLSYFLLGDGVQDVQRGVEQIQTAMKEDLQALQVQLQAEVQGMGFQFPPELQAQVPWLDGHPLGDPGEVPPGVGGGQLPPVVDHLQAQWSHEPQIGVVAPDAQSAIVHAQPEAEALQSQQSMVDRLRQSVDEMKERIRQAKESADEVAQKVVNSQVGAHVNTTQIPQHELDLAHHLSSGDTPVVELKTGVPWDDIKQVVSESGVTNDGRVASNTITDGLKDFWKALQPKDFDFNTIDQHAKFLSLDGVKSVSELPVLSDGTVGYQLSDSQLTHLAEWWKEAVQVEHPTELQQIARDLNGLETGQPMLFDELAKNPKAMQQLLDIANGVPPVAEIVK